MFCEKCGYQIPDNANYCEHCGWQVGKEVSLVPDIIEDNKNKEESTFGYAVLSFLIPILGIILGAIWKSNYPKRSEDMIHSAIASIVLGVILGIICGVIYFETVKNLINSIIQ